MKTIKRIKINLSTYFVIALYIYSGYFYIFTLFFLTFLIHELGHIFFIKLFHFKIEKIDVYPFGGIIKIDKKINCEIYKDLLISSGGFIFQVVFIFINIFFIRSKVLLNINVLLILLNLIPLIPLDGSKIMFNLLSKYIPYYYSLKLLYFLNVIFYIVFLIYEIKNSSVNFILATFLLIMFIKELKNKKMLINMFYLERLLGDFHYKKVKYHQKVNLKKLKREELSFFFDKKLKNEQEILRNKFDNCSNIWYYYLRLKGFPGKTALKRFSIKKQTYVP